MNKPNIPLLLKLVTELYHQAHGDRNTLPRGMICGRLHLCLDIEMLKKKAAKALGISKPRKFKVRVTKRLAFARLEQEAMSRGLVIERISPPNRIDGETYRYRIDDQNGMSTDIQTIDEAWSEIYHWKPVAPEAKANP